MKGTRLLVEGKSLGWPDSLVVMQRKVYISGELYTVFQEWLEG